MSDIDLLKDGDEGNGGLKGLEASEGLEVENAIPNESMVSDISLESEGEAPINMGTESIEFGALFLQRLKTNIEPSTEYYTEDDIKHIDLVDSALRNSYYNPETGRVLIFGLRNGRLQYYDPTTSQVWITQRDIQSIAPTPNNTFMDSLASYPIMTIGGPVEDSLEGGAEGTDIEELESEGYKLIQKKSDISGYSEIFPQYYYNSQENVVYKFDFYDTHGAFLLKPYDIQTHTVIDDLDETIPKSILQPPFALLTENEIVALKAFVLLPDTSLSMVKDNVVSCSITDIVSKPADFSDSNNILRYIKTNYGIFLQFPELGFYDIDSDFRIPNLIDAGDIKNPIDLQAAIAAINDDVLNRIKVFYDFYRSYIDLYHDIVHKGTVYCEHILQLFKKSVYFRSLANEKQSEFTGKVQRIADDILTKAKDGGRRNVNQLKCKQVLEELVDDFIKSLHSYDIKWLPKTKEEARILSINIDNPCEMAKLIEVLKEDGVQTFFVESANSHVGRLLANATTQGKGIKKSDKKILKVVDGDDKKLDITEVSLGQWNAGSGFSKGDIVDEITPFDERYEGVKQVKIENMTVPLFGIFGVNVEDNNKLLKLTFGNGDSNGNKKLVLKGPQKLSVNGLMAAIGEDILRSIDETKVVKAVQVYSPSGCCKNMDLTYKSMLVSLKTWTDLIQILSISKSKPYKCAVVISDALCETTARMYGLGHVLRNQGNILTYYSYDTNSRSLTQQQIEARLDTYLKLVYDKTSITQYIEKWFDEKIQYFAEIHSNIKDMKLYFISRLAIQLYQDAKKDALLYLESLPSKDTLSAEISVSVLEGVPESMEMYLENITQSASLLSEINSLELQFTEVFSGLNNLQSRSPIDIFVGLYESIKQLFVNVFTSEEDLARIQKDICASIVYYILSKPRALTYVTTFNSLRESGRGLIPSDVSMVLDTVLRYLESDVVQTFSSIRDIYDRLAQLTPFKDFIGIIEASTNKDINADVEAEVEAKSKGVERAEAKPVAVKRISGTKRKRANMNRNNNENVNNGNKNNSSLYPPTKKQKIRRGGKRITRKQKQWAKTQKRRK